MASTADGRLVAALLPQPGLLMCELDHRLRCRFSRTRRHRIRKVIVVIELLGQSFETVCSSALRVARA